MKFVAALEAHNGHRHAITQVSMDSHQCLPRSGIGFRLNQYLKGKVEDAKIQIGQLDSVKVGDTNKEQKPKHTNALELIRK